MTPPLHLVGGGGPRRKVPPRRGPDPRRRYCGGSRADSDARWSHELRCSVVSSWWDGQDQQPPTGRSRGHCLEGARQPAREV